MTNLLHDLLEAGRLLELATFLCITGSCVTLGCTGRDLGCSGAVFALLHGAFNRRLIIGSDISSVGVSSAAGGRRLRAVDRASWTNRHGRVEWHAWANDGATHLTLLELGLLRVCLCLLLLLLFLLV